MNDMHSCSLNKCHRVIYFQHVKLYIREYISSSDLEFQDNATLQQEQITSEMKRTNAVRFLL